MDSGASNTYDCYYNENWQLLEERKNGDTDPLNQYLWHPYYIDALAIRWYDANTDGDTADTNEGEFYYCYDANFNVTTIVNASGTVQNRYAYTPYGEVITLNNSFASASEATGNTHFYTGRERDSETGLQLNRNRFYHPQLGRWLQRDPLGYDDSTTNLNLYASGRPLEGSDPYGLLTWINGPTVTTITGPPIVVNNFFGGGNRTAPPGTLGWTVPRVSVSFTCVKTSICNWQLSSAGVTVTYHAEIYKLPTSSMSSAAQDAWVLRAEGDHVADFAWWAAGPGLAGAKIGETVASTVGYWTQSGCGTGTADIMKAAIAPSLVAADNASVAKWDSTGKHTWTSPARRP